MAPRRPRKNDEAVESLIRNPSSKTDFRSVGNQQVRINLMFQPMKVLRAEKDGKQAISGAMEDSENALHLFYCHTDDIDSHRPFLSRIERIKELLSSQATNGSEEEYEGLIIDQELIELENYYRRKRRMAQRKQFSNSKRKSVRICGICVTKNSSAGDNSQIHCEAKILIIAEEFSNSQILDKKICVNLWNLCD